MNGSPTPYGSPVAEGTGARERTGPHERTGPQGWPDPLEGTGPQARTGPQERTGPQDWTGPQGRTGPQQPTGRQPHTGPQDGTDPTAYGPPDPYGQQTRYDAPDPSGPMPGHAGDRYVPPDPYGPPDPHSPPDPYGRPGAARPTQSYAQPGASGPADPYGRPGAGRPADSYGRPGASGPANPSGQSPTSGSTDSYAQPDPLGLSQLPPPRYSGQDPVGWEGYGRDQDSQGLVPGQSPGVGGTPGVDPFRWRPSDGPGANGPGVIGPGGNGLGGNGQASAGQIGPAVWQNGPSSDPAFPGGYPGYDGPAGQGDAAPDRPRPGAADQGHAVPRRATGRPPGANQYPGWPPDEPDSQAEPDDSGRPSGRRVREPEPPDPADHPEWAGDDQHPGFFSGFGEDDGVDPPKRRRVRWIAPLVSIIVILAIAGAAGGYVLHLYQKRHANYVGDGVGQVTFQVKSGDGPDALAPRLVKAGVIAAAAPFEAAAKLTTKANALVPGLFRLHRHMNAAKAWALLINPKSKIETTVTVPDGMRATSIIASLAAQTKKPLSQFQKALADTSALGLPSYAHGKPEGYLFPATYNFSPGTTPLQMLQAMVKGFKQEATSLNLASGARHAQFTEGQVITAASILEAEVGPQDYPKVARVIDNRLNTNMTLGMDSTLEYALNVKSFQLTKKQLALKSPYNTLIYQGLPPGPIGSPGAKAIYAVLHPAPKSDNWLYFVTVDPKAGITKFTHSYSQFKVWSKESNQNIKTGK